MRVEQQVGRSAAWRRYVASALLHVLLVGVLVGLGHRSKLIDPTLRPGTALGLRTLSYYAPGSKAAVPAERKTLNREKEPATTSKLAEAAALVAPSEPERSLSKLGVGETSESGRGDGDIRMAMQLVFPYPKVSVPRGTNGNVVVNVVVDEHGATSNATVIEGLTPEIDAVVVATVLQWVYTPATRNGRPVASEQEIHFHFER